MEWPELGKQVREEEDVGCTGLILDHRDMVRSLYLSLCALETTEEFQVWGGRCDQISVEKNTQLLCREWIGGGKRTGQLGGYSRSS